MDKQKLASTFCVRCGKQRFFSSQTDEVVGSGNVTTMEAVCPDPECQKIVASMLEEEHVRRKRSEAIKQAGILMRKSGAAKRRADIKI